MKRKVHRITLIVVDHDDIGAVEAQAVLENNHYPNHCMAPEVIDVETREVEWTDEHPLNFVATFEKAARDLFAPPIELCDPFEVPS